MELRSCSNLHYFSALRGGRVIKAPNVNRERPVTKFKTLTEIYEAEDENNQSLNDELGGSLFGRTEVERPTISNSDVSELSCDEEDDGSSSELNDIGTSKMSLKQKRKRLIFSDDDEADLMEPLIKLKSKISKKPGGKSGSLKKPNELFYQVKLEAEEDDSDLMEPLITWKAKRPKKLKGKARSLKTKVLAPPQSPNQGVLGSSDALPALFEVKVEVVETDCSHYQIITGDSSLIYDGQEDSSRDSQSPREDVEMATECFSSDSSLICDDKAESCGANPSEAFETEAPSSPTEDLQPLVTIQDANSEFITELYSPVDSCGTVTRVVTDIAPESFSGTDKLTSEVEELHLCVVNEACYDYVEHDYPERVQSVLALCSDNNMSEIDEAEDTHDSDLPVPESEGEEYVDKPCDIECSPNNGCFQEIESTIASDTCKLDDDAKGDLTSIPEIKLGPQSCFILSPEDSPKTEDEQSQESSTFDVADKSCDDHEELTASDGDYKCDSNLDPPPQRLLSTRKSISPDSQEKLCQSMESIEIHEDEHYRPQKKLCFDPQNGKEAKVRVRFRLNEKQNVRKSKHEKRNALPIGVPRFTTGSNSIESCAQSAITFSQLQMEDFQSLASKLIEELKSMKEVVEDRLCNSDKARVAIARAVKADQVATKLLSTMARDCNRFCKIMTIAASKNESDASETEEIVNKERKKISFADEAGEELCRVKLFDENLTESPVGPEVEKPDKLN